MSDFETWWQQEGQEFLFALNTTTDDDIKLVAEVAWKNGAYCAEQAEQIPVGYIYNDITSDRMPVYLSPIRTKDLTDAFINELHKDAQDPITFARAVIAKDREKNKCQH